MNRLQADAGEVTDSGHARVRPGAQPIKIAHKTAVTWQLILLAIQLCRGHHTYRARAAARHHAAVVFVTIFS